MRTRVALLVGAVLLAGLAMAGATTAMQPDAQHADEQINGTDGDNGTDVGICMIGVDSPCNGEQWDGDNETTDSDAKRIGDGEKDDDRAGICMVGAGGPCNENESAERTTEENRSEDGSVGICMVGAGGPCNGEDGSDTGSQLTPVAEQNRTGDRVGPDKGANGEVGICLVGADSACNGDNGSSGDAHITLESSDQPNGSAFEIFLNIFTALF